MMIANMITQSLMTHNFTDFRSDIELSTRLFSHPKLKVKVKLSFIPAPASVQPGEWKSCERN